MELIEVIAIWIFLLGQVIASYLAYRNNAKNKR